MQRTLNQSLTKESGSLYIAGHQVVNLKQLDLTEECLQDDKLDSQKHFNKNFNRIKTYSQSQPDSGLMKRDQKPLNLSCSSLKAARENSRKNSKQRLEDSLKRVEQIEREWTMLKATLKPVEPLSVLKEVNEETKGENVRLESVQKAKEKDKNRKIKPANNDQFLPVKKVSRSTNQSPKNMTIPKEYYMKGLSTRVYNLDNSVSAKNLNLPPGMSSDRQVESNLEKVEKTPIIKQNNNSNVQKSEKQHKRILASSPSGQSQNLCLDSIMENPRESQLYSPLGMSSQYKSTGRAVQQKLIKHAQKEKAVSMMGINKNAKQKLSTRCTAVKPKIIKPQQSAENKLTYQNSANASGSIDQLTNKYQTSVSSYAANVATIHQNHPKPSKADVTVASKREIKKSASQEILKELLSNKKSRDGLSSTKKPQFQPNAIMVQKPTQSNVFTSIDQNSATLSLKIDTASIESETSSNYGARIPASNPMTKQQNAFSAREKQEKLEQISKPTFFNRTISSNSESIIDDNMQEGVAANYPIQKTEVKVSVISRKRTHTLDQLLPSEQRKKDDVGNEQVGFQTSSLVVMPSSNNRQQTKTKQILSLQLQPQKRNESGGAVLSYENSQTRQTKVVTQSNGNKGAKHTLTNLLQQSVKPHQNQFQQKPLSGQTKRKKLKDQSLKTPNSQAGQQSSSTGNPKVQKRSSPKEPFACILDDDSLQISVPHATKTVKNLGTLPQSSSKKERMMPQGNIINLNQIDHSSSHQILGSFQGNPHNDSFAQIPTRRKNQLNEQKQLQVVKVNPGQQTLAEKSIERSAKQIVAQHSAAMKQNALNHQSFVNRQNIEKTNSVPITQSNTAPKPKEREMKYVMRQNAHACIDLTSSEHSKSGTFKSFHNSMQKDNHRKSKVESVLSNHEVQDTEKQIEISKVSEEQSSESKNAQSILDQNRNSPKQTRKQVRKEDPRQLINSQISLICQSSQSSNTNKKGQQKHNSRKQPFQQGKSGLTKEKSHRNRQSNHIQALTQQHNQQPIAKKAHDLQLARQTMRQSSSKALLVEKSSNLLLEKPQKQGTNEMIKQPQQSESDWFDTDTIENETIHQHIPVKPTTMLSIEMTDAIEDPFKKRVNARFDATQVPSYDWNAGVAEQQERSGSTIRETSKGRSPAPSRNISEQRTKRNSQENRLQVNVEESNENRGEYFSPERNSDRNAMKIAKEQVDLSILAYQTHSPRDLLNEKRKSTSTQKRKRHQVQGQEISQAIQNIREPTDAGKLIPRNDSMHSSQVQIDHLEEGMVSPQQSIDQNDRSGTGLGREKIQQQLEDIYSELRRKKHDFEDESRQKRLSEEKTQEAQEIGFQSNTSILSLQMEESKASLTQVPEQHKFKANDKNTMVELPSSYSQYIQVAAGDVNIPQPLNQAMPVHLSMPQQHQMTTQQVAYLQTSAQPQYQQVITSSGLPLSQAQYQQIQPMSQVQHVPVQFIQQLPPQQQNQQYAIIMPPGGQHPQQQTVYFQQQAQQQPLNQQVIYIQQPNGQQQQQVQLINQPQAQQQYMVMMPQQPQLPPH